MNYYIFREMPLVFNLIYILWRCKSIQLDWIPVTRVLTSRSRLVSWSLRLSITPCLHSFPSYSSVQDGSWVSQSPVFCLGVSPGPLLVPPLSPHWLDYLYELTFQGGQFSSTISISWCTCSFLKVKRCIYSLIIFLEWLIIHRENNTDYLGQLPCSHYI